MGISEFTTVLVAGAILIAGGISAGYYIRSLVARADENKRRIDVLEQAERERRLPNRVKEETENITAISERNKRDLVEVAGTVHDVADFLIRMAGESDRIADKSRSIRANGQKSQKGK